MKAYYEDGSEVSEREFWEIVKEEYYNRCLVEQGIQRGFVITIQDDIGFIIVASNYYTAEEMLETTAEVPKREWERWCK